jgi:ABC-type uncharacterized transport system permease subunit
VYVVGAVFSQTEGFADIVVLAGAFAFHAVCMGLGTYLLGKAAADRRARRAAQVVPQK